MTPTKDLYARARKCLDHREMHLDSTLEDVYRFMMPERLHPDDYGTSYSGVGDQIYDSTAVEAVDSLANTLVASLTPPWMPFFSLQPGPNIPLGKERDDLTKNLSELTNILFTYLNTSNFMQEIQPSYLDLIAGTGIITIEPSDSGEGFVFRNVPVKECAFEEVNGRFDWVFREYDVTSTELMAKYEDRLDQDMLRMCKEEPRKMWCIVSAVVPDGRKYEHVVFLKQGKSAEDGPKVLQRNQLERNPYIIFRWSKLPNMAYGRGPAMRALPDVLYLNRIKEFALDNAALSIGGVWTGLDDGQFNPYTVQILPTTVIPVSSNDGVNPSLRRLEAGGDFNITQFTLDSLRSDIRKMFHADRFGDLNGPKMTATEVIQRAKIIAQALGATFGRLQDELLIPLVQKMVQILAEQQVLDKGLRIDGRTIKVAFVSSLAQAQQLEQMNNVVQLTTIAQQLSQIDPNAAAMVDGSKVVSKIRELLNVDPSLMRDPAEMQRAQQAMQMQAQAAMAQQQGAVPGEAAIQ